VYIRNDTILLCTNHEKKLSCSLNKTRTLNWNSLWSCRCFVTIIEHHVHGSFELDVLKKTGKKKTGIFMKREHMLTFFILLIKSSIFSKFFFIGLTCKHISLAFSFYKKKNINTYDFIQIVGHQNSFDYFDSCRKFHWIVFLSLDDYLCHSIYNYNYTTIFIIIKLKEKRKFIA